MERVILHCDLNSFYASVEELYHPEVKGKPMAVGGSRDRRHGIILAKNQQAKKYDIQTAEPVIQAIKKCPDLILMEPHFERYELYSKRVRQIFMDYTDYVEPFGMDEAWLDVTNSSYFGSGKEIADIIRERVFKELGVTCSVGVSFNKVFAKLGSDLRKPNYTTVIDKAHFKEIVWPLKCNEMIYVGKSTYNALLEMGIKTIGDLATTDVQILERVLGKAGPELWKNANGLGEDVVNKYDYRQEAKSISHSITHYRDLHTKQDLEIVLYSLAEAVASSLRRHNFKCAEITVTFRDNELNVFQKQMGLENPTNLANEIMMAARRIYQSCWHFQKPLRSVGIKAGRFVDANSTQLSLFEDFSNREGEEKIERTMDDIRCRYGHKSIKRLSMLLDESLSDYNPEADHSGLMERTK